MFKKFFSSIDTVAGTCPYCEEYTVLISLVDHVYRCTSCGEETKQHVNGRITYLKMDEIDQNEIKKDIK